MAKAVRQAAVRDKKEAGARKVKKEKRVCLRVQPPARGAREEPKAVSHPQVPGISKKVPSQARGQRKNEKGGPL